MDNRYLITGSAGFIGSSLVRSLLSEDNSILGVDNINHYYSQDLKRDRLNDLNIYSNGSSGVLETQDGGTILIKDGSNTMATFSGASNQLDIHVHS